MADEDVMNTIEIRIQILTAFIYISHFYDSVYAKLYYMHRIVSVSFPKQTQIPLSYIDDHTTI